MVCDVPDGNHRDAQFGVRSQLLYVSSGSRRAPRQPLLPHRHFLFVSRIDQTPMEKRLIVFCRLRQDGVYGQFFDRYSVAGFGLAVHHLRRGIGSRVFLACPLFQTQQRRC